MTCPSFSDLPTAENWSGELLIYQDWVFNQIGSCDLVIWALQNCEWIAAIIWWIVWAGYTNTDLLDAINNNEAVQAAIAALIPTWSSFTCADVAACIAGNPAVKAELQTWIEAGDFTLTGDWDFDGNIDFTDATVDFTWATVAGLASWGSGLPTTYTVPATTPANVGVRADAFITSAGNVPTATITVTSPCNGFALVCSEGSANTWVPGAQATSNVSVNGETVMAWSITWGTNIAPLRCQYIPVTSGQAVVVTSTVAIQTNVLQQQATASGYVSGFICG